MVTRICAPAITGQVEQGNNNVKKNIFSIVKDGCYHYGDNSIICIPAVIRQVLQSNNMGYM